MHFVSGKSLKITIYSTTFKRGNLMTPEPIPPKNLPDDDTVDGRNPKQPGMVKTL